MSGRFITSNGRCSVSVFVLSAMLWVRLFDAMFGAEFFKFDLLSGREFQASIGGETEIENGDDAAFKFGQAMDCL